MHRGADIFVSLEAEFEQAAGVEMKLTRLVSSPGHSNVGISSLIRTTFYLSHAWREEQYPLSPCLASEHRLQLHMQGRRNVIVGEYVYAEDCVNCSRILARTWLAEGGELV